jgi:hypothetical protein
MKMNSQSRSFAKQVQVDLLALDDADLFQLVNQWVRSNSAGIYFDVPEEVLSALGYTCASAESQTLPHPSYNNEMPAAQWFSPSPQQLRFLITNMDVNAFTHYIISAAFQSLHVIYPDWYEGVTFNAHLANYLRQMKKRTTSN